jgi:predicted AAA+ superfamily ATPase
MGIMVRVLPIAMGIWAQVGGTRDVADLADIVAQNPWWQDATAIDRDPKIREHDLAPFQRQPAVLDTFRLDQPNVYTLRGPRQVGKSTAVKMLIRRLVHSGFPATRVLYLSLELERQPRAIRDAVVRAKRHLRAGDSPWVIFLDELSWVRDWQTAILALRDHGDAAGDCLVLTGSSARDIRAGGERLPGRRGPGVDLDKVLLPLSFREFLEATGRAVDLPRCSLEDLAWGSNTQPIREAILQSAELDTAYNQYLQVGGFPSAVADFLREGVVSESTYQTLWHIVAGDVERTGRSHATALKLLERVVRNLCSSTSWTKLASEMAVGKDNTAEEYAQVLADSFLLLVLYFLDLARKSPSLKKEKKLYTTDPLLAHLPGHVLPGVPSPSDAELTEAVLATELFRTREARLQEAFSVPQSLFYWKSSREKEVDFLSGGPGSVVAVESKYSAQVGGQERLTIRNAFGRGLIASRQTLDLDDPVRVIPVSVVLALLG